MIVRVEKNKDYTIISNSALNDSRLSLKAKGLWAFIMTKPDKWNINGRGLATQLKEGKAAIYSSMNELEKAGYLKRTTTKKEDGTFANTDCTLYEHPLTDYRDAGYRDADNRDLDNTNKVNTEQSITPDGVGSTKKEDEVLKQFYLVTKLYSLAVLNNNHVRKWAENLKTSLGEKVAIAYLVRLQERDLRVERNTNEFVPQLGRTIDIVDKAGKIIDYYTRTKPARDIRSFE